MQITIQDKQYILDVNRAIQQGALREKKDRTITFTEDEVAVLKTVLDYVGGSPDGARGCANSAAKKLRESGPVQCQFSLEITRANSGGIFFANPK